MSHLRLGDIAPDFEQESSVGPIRFHEFLGNNWGVLFSHPADFTPSAPPSWATPPSWPTSSPSAT